MKAEGMHAHAVAACPQTRGAFRDAKARAHAAPTPADAPVIITVFPSKFISIFFSTVKDAFIP